MPRAEGANVAKRNHPIQKESTKSAECNEKRDGALEEHVGVDEENNHGVDAKENVEDEVA